MHLVDAHRLPLPLRRPAALHPLLIAPRVFAEIPDPRRGLLSGLAVKGKWIALHMEVPVLAKQFVLVVSVLRDARQKDLPNAEGDELPHRMVSPIPAIPLADD